MSCSATDTDLADDGENDILGRNAGLQPAANVNRKRLRLALQQTLCREHMSDFGRTYAERKRAECTVGACMAVATDDCLAWLGGPEFRSDHVHDATIVAVEAEQLQPEVAAVVLHFHHLIGGVFADNGQILEISDRRGRSGVVHGAERQIGPAHGQAFFAQQCERLWCRYFMNQVQVDIKDCRRIGRLFHYDVVRPDLLEQSL